MQLPIFDRNNSTNYLDKMLFRQFKFANKMGRIFKKNFCLSENLTRKTRFFGQKQNWSGTLSRKK